MMSEKVAPFLKVRDQEESSPALLKSSPGLFELGKDASWPVLIRAREEVWQVTRPLSPYRSKKRIQERITHCLSRYVAHDVNGKIMGLDGIIDFWTDDPVDPDTALEDVTTMRESMESLRHLAELLSWVAKEHENVERVFAYEEILQVFSDFLPRLFRPANALKLEASAPQGSVCAPPFPLVFWIGAFAMLLADVRQEKEEVSLILHPDMEEGKKPGADGILSRLIVELRARDIFNVVSVGEPSSLQMDFLTVLAVNGGEWQRGSDNILFTVPLKPLVPEPQCTGVWVGENPPSAEWKVLSLKDRAAFFSSLVPLLMGIEEVGVEGGMESLSQEESGFILHLVRSMRLHLC